MTGQARGLLGRARLRVMRRPLVLLAVSFTCLALHWILLRAMAHGHVAHVLLGTSHSAPPTRAALLATSLIVVRLVSVIIVPGLLLAAVAEIVAYVLVGPTGTSEDDPPTEVDA